VSRPPRTIAELAANNLRAGGLGQIKSVLQASNVCASIWAWWFVSDQLGHWPTVAEYSSAMRVTERTAYRELALFRRAFPGEKDHRRYVERLAVAVEMKQASSVLSAPADLVVA